MREYSNKFMALCIIYWKSRNSRIDWIRIIIIILLTVGNVYLAVLFNEWKNNFYTALENYDYDSLVKQIIWFSELAALAIIVTMYSFYLKQIVILNWREFLSKKFITDWLEDSRYYLEPFVNKNTDNIDQRINEDIKLFTEKTLDFTVGIINALLTFVVFMGILWNLSGVIPVSIFGIKFNIYGYIVWGALLYSLGGTFLTSFIGKNLKWLNYCQQRFEADFRYAMMRLKENREQIAVYHGEAVEKNIIFGKLVNLLNNFKFIIKKERQITAFKSGYFQIASIIPVLFGVPLYLNNTIKLGGLMQSASAFSRVTGSLSYFIMLYNEFAEYAACKNRLYDLLIHLKTVDKFSIGMNHLYKTDPKYLKVKDFILYTPAGNLLFSCKNLNIEKGNNVLFLGVNGCGKSTFFKAIAGIYPYYEGTLVVSEAEKMMFLSQKPYFPLGELRNAIFYPNTATDVSNIKIDYYLKYFNLEYLIDKLNTEADWSNILSLGEQQKIAVIRACLLKPEWLFMDESTSNMDIESIEKTYEILKKLNITVIGIGHYDKLKNYHSKFVEIKNQIMSQSSL